MTWVKKKNGTKSSRLERPELLQRAIDNGQLKEDDLIAYTPDGPWRPLSDVKGLSFPKHASPTVEWRTYGGDGSERKRKKDDYELNSNHKNFEKGATIFKWVIIFFFVSYATIISVSCIQVMGGRYCSTQDFNKAGLVMVASNFVLYGLYWMYMMGVNFMCATLGYLRKISDAEHG